MPKVPVDECPAGPAMDAAVAQALGIKTFPHPELWDGSFGGGGWCPICKHSFSSDAQADEISCLYPPQYSTDIAAAEKLWDKLAEDHWVVSVCYGPGRDGCSYASVQMQLDIFLAIDLLARIIDLLTRSPMDMDAKGETKALAISRAFLKANGVEEIEVP